MMTVKGSISYPPSQARTRLDAIAQWKACCNLRSARRGFVDRERSFKFLCPFTHRGQANPGPIRFLNTFAVVIHLDLEGILHQEAYLARVSVRMTDDISNRLLHNAVGRNLHCC